MNETFAWHIMAETEWEELSFPAVTSEDKKVTDKQIRKYLRVFCKVGDVDIPWNFIYNLTFIAADLNGHRYAESLSPRDFWPTPAMEFEPENRSKFRSDSKTKKGGEE